MNDAEYRIMFEVEDRHWWYITLRDLVVRFVEREFHSRGPLKLFDAGCGTGGMMGRLARFGEVSGCDQSPHALACCRERGLANVMQQDLNDLQLPPDSFDVITILDVLYHDWITSDEDVLSRLFAALKPGGLLIMNDPAFESLRGTHDVAVLTRRRYTRGRMRELLRRAGFRVERTSYRLLPLFLPIAIFRLIGRICRPRVDSKETPSDVWMPRPLVNAALRFIGYVDNALITCIDLPLGTSVFSMARKPSA